MRPRPILASLILAAALLPAAACQSVEPERELLGARAVVIYASDREAEARDAAERLAAVGFDVTTEREGPPVRSRSSVAMYRVARVHGDVIGPTEEALGDIPDLQWLPFVHGGPPRTDVVLWLVSADRDAAARAAAAETAPDED